MVIVIVCIVAAAVVIVIVIIIVVMYDFIVKPVVFSVVWGHMESQDLFMWGPHVQTIFIIILNCCLSFSVSFS